MITLLIAASLSLGQVEEVYLAPSYLRASIWVNNGSTRCSGGVILKGEKYAYGLSAAHCFEGRIGGKFTVGNIYGDVGDAELLAHDRDRDLALFRFSSELAHGVVCIPGSMRRGAYLRKLGYTGGRGPNRARVTYRSRSDNGVWFDVESGKFGHGDSGGYVYALQQRDPTRGNLVAVVHGGSGDLGGGEGYEVFGPGLPEIHSFLSWNSEKITGGPFNLYDADG